ncbi:MAG: BRCT domain-containing protein, partial [Candidatus Dormibacteraceae bacterium]
IRAATVEGLQEVEGIGPSMASEIARFFSTEGGKLVDRLLAAGVSPASPPRPAPGGPLDGLRFVFTGSLEAMSRPQAEARVRSLGARTSASISARTDYVVVGSEAGSKLERSRRLEIPILDEAAFLELLESHHQP